MNGIKSWSEEDRPREKLMLKGVESLSDAELIAILIGSGTKEKSAVQVSREILGTVANDLHRLSQLTIHDLTKIKGIGQAKAITVVASMELGRRRLLQGREQKYLINSSKAAYDCIGPMLMDLPHEEFWILLLDRKLQLIQKVQISGGGSTATVVDKSILLRHAINHLAQSIILVHNHPSGSLEPSRADDQLTKSLVEGARHLDIVISDHIIVGGSQYYSYSDNHRI